MNGEVGRLQFVFEFEGGMDVAPASGDGVAAYASGGGRDVLVLGQGVSIEANQSGINGVYMTYNC